ncbi:MAG: DUF4397 domain-containing protein [Gemmatimonadetes bacterium]|nr:DUF4397 domain-containing protein [Gemmatimonadota bacterium]
MRPSRLSGSATLRRGVLVAALTAGCQPTTTTDVGGGSTGGTTLNKLAVASYTHVMMTTNAFSSTLGWKVNGTLKTSGTAYLGRALNDTVRFASSTPLVPFEGNNNGGTTAFFSDSWLLTDGAHYSGFGIGVLNSSDPNTAPRFVLAQLDTVTPAANKAHVRFAHFMPGVGPVDVWTGAPGSEAKVITALGYGAISAYQDIQGATGTIPSINVIVTPTGVAPGGANVMTVSGVSTIANPSAYTVAMVFTQSNLSVATTKSIAIYLER